MDTIEQDDEPKGFWGFFRKRAVLTSLAVLAFAGIVVLAARFSSGDRTTLRPSTEVSVVRVALPPPPPPPAPRPEPKPREDTPVNPQEMVVAEPVPDEAPAEAPDPAAPDSPAEAGGEAMGTNIQGDGTPNAFGLAGSGHGGIIGGTGSGFGPRGGGRGNQWGRYTGLLQSQIQSAMLRNKKTRQAALDVVVRLWPDASGGMARAELVHSTGDAALDEAVQNEVLAKLILREAPPSDMPLPIVMRIAGERPL